MSLNGPRTAIHTARATILTLVRANARVNQEDGDNMVRAARAAYPVGPGTDGMVVGEIRGVRAAEKAMVRMDGMTKRLMVVSDHCGGGFNS